MLGGGGKRDAARCPPSLREAVHDDVSLLAGIADCVIDVA